MPRKVQTSEVPEGSRIDLHGMEFRIASKRRRTIPRDTYEGVVDHTYYELKLDDGLHREFEDTGQLVITRDPDDQLKVLDSTERIASRDWEWEPKSKGFWRTIKDFFK